MGCDDIYELLSVYADDCVTNEERTAVEKHLADCPACRKELDDIKNVISHIQFSNPQKDVPENFIDELRNRIAKEAKQKSKVVKFNASSVFKYSGIAACVSLALLSGTFFNDYYLNKDKYTEIPGNVITSNPLPAAQTAAPEIDINIPDDNTVNVTSAPVAVSDKPNSNIVIQKDKPSNNIVVNPTTPPEPPSNVNGVGYIDQNTDFNETETKRIEVADQQANDAKSRSLFTTIDSSASNSVIQNETDNTIVISKLPTENVSKLAYVTNVSLATDSVDVEYLGTSFKFHVKSKYNTKVFKFYDTTKEMLYENSNICYERIVDYTDEYIYLANQVNDIITSNSTLNKDQIDKLRVIASRISEIESMVGYNILIF